MATLPDIDELIARIREEAQRPEYQVPEPAPLEPLRLSQAPAAAATRTASPASAPAAATPDTLEDFLLIPAHADFVEQAYQRLLGRAADAAGAAYYGARLQQGYGRPFVLAALAAAREPAGFRGEVAGLGLAPVVYNLWRVLRRLGLGSVGRWANAGYHGWRQLRLLISPREPAALGALPQERQLLQRQAERLQVLGGEHESLERRLRETRSQLEAQPARCTQAIAQLRAQLEPGLAALQSGLERVDRRAGRLDDGVAGQADALRAQDQRLEQLQRELAVTRAALQAQRNQLDALLRGAGDGARASATASGGSDAPAAAATAAATGTAGTPAPAAEAALAARIDRYYDAFEAHCRGSEAAVRDKQRPYLDLIAAQPAPLRALPVIDVGSGRGEWLALLRDAGLPALGIDSSATLAAHCRNRGLEVIAGDAVAVLAKREACSAAAISALHVVEHLPFELLFRLLEEMHRVLAPGGLLILETPNPENLLVGSHTFYHDFSHRNPVTPTALEFLVGYQGFTGIELRRLHPYREEALIREDSVAARRLNVHLYGAQDFAVVARRPVEGAVPAAPAPAGDGTADGAVPPGPAGAAPAPR